MTTTETIDQRIRKTSNETLSADIAAAAKPLALLCACGQQINVNLPAGACSVFSALNAVTAALYSFYREKREEEAVTAFLSRVDLLQEEVDALRHSITN